MKLLAKCPICHKRRLFIKSWTYKSFTGDIFDKEENPKCYWCKSQLQKVINGMGVHKA